MSHNKNQGALRVFSFHERIEYLSRLRQSYYSLKLRWKLSDEG